MKVILKKTLIIILLICILIPSLLSGFVLGAEVPLTRERAGNYVANFAINFFENWSSIHTVEGDKKLEISVSDGEVLQAGQKIYDEILLGNKNIDYIAAANRDSSRIANDRSYYESTGADCTSYVCAALWLAGYEQFAKTVNSETMRNKCRSGEYSSYGFELYKTDGSNVYQWSDTTSEYELLSGVTPYEVLQPGDVIVVRGSMGHANIVKEVLPESSNAKYIALDCGNAKNWQDVDYYNSQGGGLKWDCWTNPRRSSGGTVWGFYGCSEAYLMRSKNGTGTTAVGKATTTAIIRGEIKTEYNENASDEVDPTAEKYEFSNKSWISFVYKQALSMSDEDILVGDALNTNELFDNEDTILGDAIDDTTIVIDIAKFVNEGTILPGDVLFIDDGTGNGALALYVGGAKIIYAAPPRTEEGTSEEDQTTTSALYYEYLQYYLRRIENNLREGHEDDEDYELPPYGITKIYRIKEDYVLNNKTQADTNLIFNEKGYYSYTDYDGVPQEITYLGSEEVNIFKWIIEFFKDIIEFLLSLITYIIRMQILGWANIFESLIQSVVLGISGHNTGTIVESTAGVSATSASGQRISVDSIFFNQIPILDANFFDFETAGGHTLMIEKEIKSPTASGRGNEIVKVIDESNIVYQLRKNLVIWYYIIRNASYAILLFVLLYLGIKLAISAAAEKKAEAKKLLTSWVVSFLIITFLHNFMYIVLEVNNTLVNVCENLGISIAQDSVYGTEEGEEGKEKNQLAQEELNLYDAVRAKAYSFSYKEGVPATIIYIYLIYLLLRFLLIYAKRYLTIYILAIMGSFMGVKHALEKIAGKKTTTLSKWMKEFAFNVLLQTVHAFIYVIYMGVAINMASTNLAGFFVCLIVLNFMLKADKIIMKIFGLNKANSLADVNTPESYMSLVAKAMPIYYIHKKAFNGIKNGVFGERGIWSEIQYSIRGYDNYKDAIEDAQDRKLKNIGEKWQKRYDNQISGNTLFGRLERNSNIVPIRKLAANINKRRLNDPNMRLRRLNRDISFKSKKGLYDSIKQAKKMKKQQFTRKIGFTKDVLFGIGGTVAAIGLAIDNPADGLAAMAKSVKTINKHRTLGSAKRRYSKYGPSKQVAKAKMEDAKTNYNNILNTYTDNQFQYEQEMERLRGLEAAETDATRRNDLNRQMQQLKEQREERAAVELDELRESYEKMYKATQEYKFAKKPKVIAAVESTVENLTGATVLADMAASETLQSDKSKEKISKLDKKIADMEKATEIEEQLRSVVRELKGKYKEVHETLSDKDNIDIDDIIEKDINQANRDSRQTNVSSTLIKRTINEYLYNNNKEKITSDDVELILDQLEEQLDSRGSRVKFTSAEKARIKAKMKKLMIADKKGLGYETKDATTKLRELIESEVKTDSRATVNSKVKNAETEQLHAQMITLMRKLYTSNEIGIAKHGSSIVNISKVLSDLKKI